ncbi:MAG: hypothetical protein IPK85_05270 [Gemmatimonadetes bacterium]|nr:hypothetical protein [Gemmatimonadota bacterium]
MHPRPVRATPLATSLNTMAAPERQREPEAPPLIRRAADQRRSGGPPASSRLRVLGPKLARGAAIAGLMICGLAAGRTIAITRGGAGGSESGAVGYAVHVAANPNAPLNVGANDFRGLQQVVASVDPALVPMNVDGATAELLHSLQAGATEFASVRLFDTVAEDGDVVTLTTDTGARFGPFRLTNAGNVVNIPVAGGRLPTLTLHAIKDGNGGVTVGATTSVGTWYSGIIPEGGQQVVPMGRQ